MEDCMNWEIISDYRCEVGEGPAPRPQDPLDLPDPLGHPPTRQSRSPAPRHDFRFSPTFFNQLLPLFFFVSPKSSLPLQRGHSFGLGTFGSHL